MSLVWINEKLHLQVYQTVLPGFELLLHPQSFQKSLSVLHPKLEEGSVAEEESATQEEVASPREDSAESCTGMYPVNISLSSGLHKTLSHNKLTRAWELGSISKVLAAQA